MKECDKQNKKIWKIYIMNELCILCMRLTRRIQQQRISSDKTKQLQFTLEYFDHVNSESPCCLIRGGQKVTGVVSQNFILGIFTCLQSHHLQSILHWKQQTYTDVFTTVKRNFGTFEMLWILMTQSIFAATLSFTIPRSKFVDMNSRTYQSNQ